MMKAPNQFRVRTGTFATLNEDHNNGLFLIPHGSDVLQCIASDGLGWEHVSVTVRIKNRNRCMTPTWETMCIIKDIFWDSEDVVIQFHPAKSEYVNNHRYVLHLWRPINKEFPIPDSILVGIK